VWGVFDVLGVFGGGVVTCDWRNEHCSNPRALGPYPSD